MCIAMFWMEIRVGFPNSPVLQKHLCTWFNGCDVTFLHLWVFSEMLHKPVFCLWARFLINFDDNHTETDGTWHFCLFYVNDPWGAAVFVWSDYLRGLLFSSLYLSRVFFFFFDLVQTSKWKGRWSCFCSAFISMSMTRRFWQPGVPQKKEAPSASVIQTHTRVWPLCPQRTFIFSLGV